MRTHSTMRVVNTRSLKRRCIGWSVAALVILAGFIASGGRSFEVSGGGIEASLSGATLVLGQAPAATSNVSVKFFRYSWFDAQSAWWRPIHTRSAGRHSIVFPLWQPLLLTTAVAMYGWGRLRGCRTADAQQCRGCGYSLVGLPETDEQRCPECGRPTITAAPA